MDPLFFLIFSVSGTIVVSALCSLMEASLYAVPLSYVRSLEEKGLRSGKILSKFKADIGQPIAAILILNTLSNTGGASLAGWAGGKVLSESGAVLFSIAFVVAILYLSEIIPKTIGVTYANQVSRALAFPLQILVRILAPFIFLSQFINRRLKTGSASLSVSEEEVKTLAALGAEEGSLQRFEGSVISNVLGLDDLMVRDVLTPRVVVFRLDEEVQLCDIRDEMVDWNFSRVPLFQGERPDDLTAYVTQRDIYREILRGNDEISLKSISRKLETVPELLRVDHLLLRMFEKKEHICAVVDEHGGLAGIVTLEDVIEEIVGREIVDEYDTVSDLRTFARVLSFMKSRSRRRGFSNGSAESSSKRAASGNTNPEETAGGEAAKGGAVKGEGAQKVHREHSALSGESKGD
ncbi:hemolysin family protein [bacterium]|nr:hemolysin family protein [bacterium]